MGSQGVGHDWVTELKIFTSKSHSRVPILSPSHHSETTFGNPEVSYISSWINTGFYHVISFVLLHSLRPLLIHLSSDAFNLHGAVKFGSLLWEQRRRWWHPTPVLLPGKSHGWRSLGGCSPWGREESDTTDFSFTFHFHTLEKEMATHSSVPAWRIPGTGEPDGLPSMGSNRVWHDWIDLAAAAAVWEQKKHI